MQYRTVLQWSRSPEALVVLPLALAVTLSFTAIALVEKPVAAEATSGIALPGATQAQGSDECTPQSRRAEEGRGEGGSKSGQLEIPPYLDEHFIQLSATLRTTPYAEDINITPASYLRAAGQMRWRPDQLRNAAIIIETGQQMGVPERGIVIALATSLQEFSLQNYRSGDRDSVGLFQQRTSTGWGPVDLIMQPQYAAAAFFDGPKRAGHISKLTNSTETATYSSGGVNVPWGQWGLLKVAGWESMSVTQAAQTVQGSAHPMLYQQWRGHAEKIFRAVVARNNAAAAEQMQPEQRAEAEHAPGQSTENSVDTSSVEC